MSGDTNPPRSAAVPGEEASDARRRSLIASLRQRFLAAEARADAEAKQALFREAVYLNLPPPLWQGPLPESEEDVAGDSGP